MSINQNLLNALLLQYRGKALAAHAAIEELLKKPSEDGIVEDITRQTQRLMEYEALMNTLKRYFGQKEASIAPQSSSEEKRVETPEVSPTHGKSLEVQVVREAGKEETPGEQLYKKYLDGAAE
tara:strand:+ start:406 stop:774 length:369 start_codon:yes stop_codon:yes gene_type:complete